MNRRATIVPQACTETKKDWLHAPIARPVQNNHRLEKHRASIVPPVLTVTPSWVHVSAQIVLKALTTKMAKRSLIVTHHNALSARKENTKMLLVLTPKMTVKSVKGFHSINILANQGAISARKHSIKAVPRARAVTQVNTSMAILVQYVRWASTRRVELNPSVRHVRLATMAKI